MTKASNWLHASAACALAVCLTALLKGSALSQPPNEVRTWEITTSTTSAETRFTMTALGGDTTALRRSRSVLLVHDTSGGADIFCAFSDVAAIPTNGGVSFRLKASETINIDGEFNRASFRSASATPAVRMIVTF